MEINIELIKRIIREQEEEINSILSSGVIEREYIKVFTRYLTAARVILQKGLAVLSGSTAGPAGSNARGEGNGGGTGIHPVYEPSLAEAGIPRL